MACSKKLFQNWLEILSNPLNNSGDETYGLTFQLSTRIRLVQT